jgi:hypothetical protein
MHTTIDQGHKFQLQNRCEDGTCAEQSFQTLEFLKIENAHVESVGLFTQDVIAVLIERARWQHENTPYKEPEIEEFRRQAIFKLQGALDSWNQYTNLRLMDGAKLLGHIKDT